MSPAKMTATGAQSGASATWIQTISPAGIVAMVAAMLRVRRERRQLLALDDRMLKDIGMSRGDAYAEASRPLHDVPFRRNFR
ncbi:MAG: DUF1127 domain-containing protein [Hyphomicrobiaceae bacterium]